MLGAILPQSLGRYKAVVLLSTLAIGSLTLYSLIDGPWSSSLESTLTGPLQAAIDGKEYHKGPPSRGPFGAIVAAGRVNEDLSWMMQLSANWTAFPYDVDNTDPSAELQIPRNKGHEAMVYLSYIIDNYAKLPWSTVFVHGHRESWHQDGDIIPRLQSLRLSALAQEGYINLRCDWYPSCAGEVRPYTHDAIVWGPGVHREDAEYGISEAWPTLFPNETMPETIASQCCAQFAVTSWMIRRRPRESYERMRQWLLDTELIDDVSGRVMEKLWAYIFTGNGVHCPAPQQCSCDFFGQCEPHDWPIPPKGLPPLPEG